ncbi:MAG: hypothetical protein ACYCXU_05035 [Thermoleophilia bacterium]
MTRDYSEDALVEQPAIALFRESDRFRGSVKLAIEEELDRLPEAFTARLYEQKCASIYQHVYDSYFGMGKSIYTATVRARLAPGPRD